MLGIESSANINYAELANTNKDSLHRLVGVTKLAIIFSYLSVSNECVNGTRINHSCFFKF